RLLRRAGALRKAGGWGLPGQAPETLPDTTAREFLRVVVLPWRSASVGCQVRFSRPLPQALPFALDCPLPHSPSPVFSKSSARPMMTLASAPLLDSTIM